MVLVSQMPQTYPDNPEHHVGPGQVRAGTRA